MSATPELKRIPLASIRENPVALRGVNRQDAQYLGLVDSVKRDGVLNAILVREIPSQDGTPLYGIIEGLHRYTASLDANKSDIPAQILNVDDAKVLKLQLIGNAQKIETRPVEYSKHLQRILATDPTTSITLLAQELSKSPAWLSERLGLLKLDKSIAELVDTGKINLSNAYMLAKLPIEEQASWIDRAMTMTPQEFTPTASARKRELDTAKRQGRDSAPAEFVPVPHLRKLSELKTELETPTAGPVLCRKLEVKTPDEGFALGIRFALNLDPESIANAKAKDELRKKAAADEKVKAAAERAKQRAQEAAEAAAKLQAAGG